MQSGRIDLNQVFRQAAAMHSQGRLWEAETLYQAVLAEDRRNFDATYQLGHIRLQQNRFADAEVFFRRAVKIDKKSADAQHKLAIALTGAGRLEEAIKHYQNSQSLKPNVAETYNNLGYTLQQLGRHDEAVKQFLKALTINQGYAEAHNNLGNALQSLKKPQEAIQEYRQALVLRPNFFEAHNGLASALTTLNLYTEAIKHCEMALAIAPNSPEAHINFANALGAADRPQDALAHYQKAIASDPFNPEPYTRASFAFYRLGKIQDAVTACEKALAMKPDHAGALAQLGTSLRALGRMDEATQYYEKAIAGMPSEVGIYHSLVNSKRMTVDDQHFIAVKKLADKIDTFDTENQISLHFALGKAFDDVNDHQRSFQHFLKGNALKRQEFVEYNEVESLARFERISSTFSSEMLQERKNFGDPSNVPIFIVGMPRSGSTLVEQVLASHPSIFGAGELREFGNLANKIVGSDGSAFPEAAAFMSSEQVRTLGAQYVNSIQSLAPGAQKITDKMPSNFLNVGLIHLALPNARIIHTRRDLRDIAMSCFSTLFAVGQAHTYDLAELGRYLRAYEKIMEHWRKVLPKGIMIEVEYEKMVGNLEAEARLIIEHCGLQWDDACLSFYKNSRPVLTASVAQVREPVYNRSVERWRRYENELQPLLQALDEP
jgi:tetratricopeptide (TPR) repeat protein